MPLKILQQAEGISETASFFFHTLLHPCIKAMQSDYTVVTQMQVHPAEEC